MSNYEHNDPIIRLCLPYYYKQSLLHLHFKINICYYLYIIMSTKLTHLRLM